MDAQDLIATLCRVRIAQAFVRELALPADSPDASRQARTLNHLAEVEADLTRMRDLALACERASGGLMGPTVIPIRPLGVIAAAPGA